MVDNQVLPTFQWSPPLRKMGILVQVPGYLSLFWPRLVAALLPVVVENAPPVLVFAAFRKAELLSSAELKDSPTAQDTS